MPTNRIPLRRAVQIHVTPAAVEAFRRLLELDAQCTCPPPAYPNQHEDCPACEQWWERHDIIAQEMGARPWEAPCVIEPGEDGQDDTSDPLRRALQVRMRSW